MFLKLGRGAPVPFLRFLADNPGMTWGADFTDRYREGGIGLSGGQFKLPSQMFNDIPANEPTADGLTVTSGNMSAVQGYGPELVPSTAWTTTGGWSESGGVLTASAASTADACNVSPDGTILPAGTYEATFAVSVTSGSVRTILYSTSDTGVGTTRSTSATFTERITIDDGAGSLSDKIRFQAFPTTFTGTVSLISIKRVLPFPGYTDEGVMLYEWRADGSGTNRMLGSIVGANAGNDGIQHRVITGDAWQNFIIAGGVTQANIVGGTVVDDTIYQAAYGLAPNKAALAVDRAQIGSTDTSVVVPVVEQMLVAGRGTSEWAGGELKSIRYIPGPFDPGNMPG